jgi:twitching motility protein PilT
MSTSSATPVHEPDLNELEFQNLYLSMVPGAAGKYAPRTGRTIHQALKTISPQYRTDLETLRETLREKIAAHPTRTRFVHNLAGVRVRATVIHQEEDDIAVVLRRIPPNVPALLDLNIAGHILEPMREWLRKPGIVLVSGTFGTGKTTTASTLFHDYLEIHGGLGIAMESPVEFPLKGDIGQGGLCYQIEIDETHERAWDEAAANTRKSNPAIVFIGEISSPAIARTALSLSTTGRPILATIHGSTHAETIENLIDFAGRDKTVDPRRILAHSLTGIALQTLVGNLPAISLLDVDDEGAELRQAIKDDDEELFTACVSRQDDRLAETTRQTYLANLRIEL